MIWVALSVFTASLLFVVFKLFDRYNVHRFSAVVINYFFAGCTGVLLFNVQLSDYTTCSNCLLFIGCLGIVFISLFNLIGLVTVKNGTSISVLANKMAFVIPVVLSIVVFNEPVSVQLIVAILIGLLGLYLALKPDNNQQNQMLFWPIILFIGSGILDFLLKLGEKFILTSWNPQTLTIGIFASAFLWGGLFGAIKNQFKLTTKNILWGAILGVPNFFSIYFLFKAIASFSNQSAVIFPLNNVGIILCTSVAAFLLFKEKLNRIKVLGLLLCICSIIILAYFA